MTQDHPTPAHLRATALIDSDAPTVQAFAAEHARGTTDRERAVALYLAVRDGFRYDPYRIDLSPQGMTASSVLANGYGWCVPKAALLTAACRAAGPSRAAVSAVAHNVVHSHGGHLATPQGTAATPSRARAIDRT